MLSDEGDHNQLGQLQTNVHPWQSYSEWPHYIMDGSPNSDYITVPTNKNCFLTESHQIL